MEIDDVHFDEDEYRELIESLLPLFADLDAAPSEVKPDDMQVFTGDTAAYVSHKITVARNAVCDALRGMRAGAPGNHSWVNEAIWSEEVKALVNTPTYKQLGVLLVQLDRLSQLTQATVSVSVRL